MSDKVYEPDTIQDSPFPKEGQESLSVDVNTNEPATIKDNPLPTRIVAVDLIGPTLNTQSRKIISEFQFTPSGAIQIGKYDPGVNGDIRISPTGIVARNKDGVSTVTIDGETGDATFKGTILAGDVTVVDDGGLVSLSAFDSGSSYTAPEVDISTANITTYDDIDDSVLTFELARETRVLVSYTVNVGLSTNDSANVFSGRVVLSVNGTNQTNSIFHLFPMALNPQDPPRIYKIWGGPLTATGFLTLPAGPISLLLRVSTVNTNSTMTIYSASINYVTLGR